MREESILCGQDVEIAVDGKFLMQAQHAEVRCSRELILLRSCFSDETAAIAKGRSQYKATIRGVRFRKPFVNCSFADLDHFTLSMTLEGKRLTLTGCEWEDFWAAADEKAFSEHITVRAAAMKTEEAD